MHAVHARETECEFKKHFFKQKKKDLTTTKKSERSEWNKKAILWLCKKGPKCSWILIRPLWSRPDPMFVLASFAGLWYLCFVPAPGFPGFSSLQSQVQSRFVNFRQPSTGLLLAKLLQAKTGKPWISITSKPIVFRNNPEKHSAEKQPWFYLWFEELRLFPAKFASLHTYIRNLAPFFKNQ